MSDDVLNVWQDSAQIRRLFAKGLTNDEFEYFARLGSTLGADPYKREIWAVKYGGNAAQIFLGRDFYRRKAQEQGDYEVHIVDAVYSNDEFSVSNGLPSHKYNLKDRGSLLGAYCLVHKKDSDKPYFAFAEFREYSTGKSLWRSKPSMMIKKVAEAQGLRGAYQGVFGGTYDESEVWEEKDPRLDKLITAVRKRLSKSPIPENLKDFWYEVFDNKIYTNEMGLSVPLTYDLLLDLVNGEIKSIFEEYKAVSENEAAAPKEDSTSS
ncbi:MAG: recombinase RecT [bacterium]|nr:recombinase RecT [bacterium]